MVSINLGNFGGTLCYQDTELCDFKFIDDRLNDSALRILCAEPFLIPAPMVNYTDDIRWHMFFESQCLPSTRYNIDKDLLTVGVFSCYNAEQILRYTDGRNVANHYWVKCDDDLSCWEQWQIVELKKRGIIS